MMRMGKRRAAASLTLVVAAGLTAGAAAPSAAPLPSAPACPVFPAGNVWNQDISALPVASDSGTLIAKIGLNAAGLAVGTNFLLTQTDGRTDGVPYHLTLRSLLDAESLPDAFRRLQEMPRATSANYLLVHADGVAVDVEAAPGGPDELHLSHAVTDGVARLQPDAVAVEPDAAAVRRLKVVDAPQQRALTRPGRSDHTQHLSELALEAHAPQDLNVAK